MSIWAVKPEVALLDLDLVVVLTLFVKTCWDLKNLKTCFESHFHNVINVAKKWVFSTIPTNKELQMVKYTKPSSSVLRAKVAQQRFSYFS